MVKPRFDAEFDDYYAKCLRELKARANWTEAFIPQLDRFVMVSMKLSQISGDLVDAEITQDHTNKAKATNEVSSAKWRMFIQLNREANSLARELQLTPCSAPVTEKKKDRKGFDLGMKVA